MRNKMPLSDSSPPPDRPPHRHSGGEAAPGWTRACAADEVAEGRAKTVALGGRTIAIFRSDGRLFAVDNRCPHMGFPLDRGSLRDCILTCHWHHARFDVNTGGAFDQWADDVNVFPLLVNDGEVLIDMGERDDARARCVRRLGDGLERNIALVIGKSVIGLADRGALREGFRIGLEFGVRNRRDGWGSGLTTLTCMANLMSSLGSDDRARAFYQGLADVADDTGGNPPRFAIRPLPGSADLPRLKRWMRRFVEVRDSEGAERCITTAVRSGAGLGAVADLMFAAATDHRYLSIGHVLDFTNKAFEALDHGAQDLAEPVLASLARSYAMADRMEESNAWRNPIDLVAICERAFEAIPGALEDGRKHAPRNWDGAADLTGAILSDDPREIAGAIVSAIRAGAMPVDLARTVSYAAAIRIARFHVSNEFGDWDTAHHSFTFSCAVHQAMRRAPSPELLRAVFDAAMSVYLNRFLNVPAARIPNDTGPGGPRPDELLDSLPALLDRQQQVDQVGALAARYLGCGGDADALIAGLGGAMLREDRDFHTIQNLEAAVRLHSHLGATAEGVQVLIATARYLAAHSPTMRAQEQTWRIATRLHRGERLFDG